MVARMRREIEAARLFGDCPHVMPVLDHSPAFDWFIMPLADATASTLAGELARPEALRELVEAVCAALRVPHEQGWIHRDLKPDNLLWLDGRWVVADWGLGRRPRGQTTDAGRTRMGTAFGTEGFAAPELAVDAHAAGPQADVYSIGQIIGWALTGRLPHANIALLPADGPWRTIVKAATAHDVQRRLASVDDLLATMADELDSPDAVIERGRQLLADARAGDPGAGPRLLRLAAQSGEHYQALQEDLLGLDNEQIRMAVAADPSSAAEIVRMLRGPVPGGSAVARERGVAWLLVVARQAEVVEQWDLLDEAIDSLLVLSGQADDLDILARVAEWMATRAGQAASSLAVALRRLPAHPQVRTAVSGNPGTDHRILRALRSRTAAGPTPAAPQRGRKRLLLGAAAVLLAASAIGTVALVDWGPPGEPQAKQSGNPIAGLPRKPGELALFPMEDFVEPWNGYPSWAWCSSEIGEEAVNGSFPARPAGQVHPKQHIRCDNGGGLTAMFAEFKGQADFEVARARYLGADPPANPARGRPIRRRACTSSRGARRSGPWSGATRRTGSSGCWSPTVLAPTSSSCGKGTPGSRAGGSQHLIHVRPSADPLLPSYSQG